MLSFHSFISEDRRIQQFDRRKSESVKQCETLAWKHGQRHKRELNRKVVKRARVKSEDYYLQDNDI